MRAPLQLAVLLTLAGSAAPLAAQQPEFDPAHAAKMQAGLDLFKSQVRQVLVKQCVDCHGGDEVESGFDLATRKGLLRGGSHGPAVVAGKSADSNVVRFISHREKPFMPDGANRVGCTARSGTRFGSADGGSSDCRAVVSPASASVFS